MEGAAGLAGIVKAVLVLEKAIVPPNALFEKMHPNIDAESYHVAVPTKCLPWPSSGLRRVSVNSFGFGGSNAHVVLDDAYHTLRTHGLIGNHCTVSHPPMAMDGFTEHGDGNSAAFHGEAFDMEQETFVHNNPPRLLVWSAADLKTLAALTQQYEGYLKNDIILNETKLNQVAYTLEARRSLMPWRTFAILRAMPELPKLLVAQPLRASPDVRLGFVFTGQGAQAVNMGIELIRYDVFRRALQKMDGMLHGLGSCWSIFGKSCVTSTCECKLTNPRRSY